MCAHLYYNIILRGGLLLLVRIHTRTRSLFTDDNDKKKTHNILDKEQISGGEDTILDYRQP